MYEFLEQMKEYIKSGINADRDITSKIECYDAYTKGHTPTKTEIQFQILDNNEVDRYTTFDKAGIWYIPIQFNIYAFQMKIAGTMEAPRVVSIKVADKVLALLNADKVTNSINSVKRVRVMTTTPAMPFEGGEKVYTTAIRCEFWVAK